MTVVSGFYNSVNGDRKYDADAFGRLFEGVIRDGVFLSVGDQFKVSLDSGMRLKIGTGKAWCIRTWAYNDQPMTTTLADADQSEDRIDLVCLEFDRRDNVRNTDIRVVKGEPRYDPVRPVYVKDPDRVQLPLAFVTVRAKATSIVPTDIAYVVGTDYCPFVVGVNGTISLGQYIDDIRREWADYRDNQKLEFLNWFKDLKYTLSGDAGAKLMNRLDSAIKELQITQYGLRDQIVKIDVASDVVVVTERTTVSGAPVVTTKIFPVSSGTIATQVYDDPSSDKLIKTETTLQNLAGGSLIKTTRKEIAR